MLPEKDLPGTDLLSRLTPLDIGFLESTEEELDIPELRLSPLDDNIAIPLLLLPFRPNISSVAAIFL